MQVRFLLGHLKDFFKLFSQFMGLINVNGIHFLHLSLLTSLCGP